MTTSDDDRLAELFDALVGLDAPARARALDAAGLDAIQRAELQALLDADRSHDARLDRALSGAASRLHELSTPLPTEGATIGAWQIERELGSGGMGTVFLAHRADAGDAQRGALKLLRGFPTEEGRKRLRQERRVLATLEHPFIARLLDGGETADGQPYFVMEYVEGEPATAFAARQGLDTVARVALVDRIAEGVAHAHQRLVIHRDLKPSNVLVRADGTPRVLDFGVAKLVDVAGDTGGTSTRVWTPGYASPEQKAGQAVTTSTDVYALGVLLRELLTGQRPDGGACDPPLSPVALDADLRGILAKAAADEAAARYPTVEALRDDLARWRDGRPVRAARDTALYRARKFVRRHRGSVSLVLLVLVALGAFIWRLGVERNRALEAEALAAQRAIAAEQSARVARNALDFFSGLMGEVVPDRAQGRSVDIDVLLAKGRARLQRELPENSADAAMLGGYLGTLHGTLGEPRRAIELLEPALSALSAGGLDDGTTWAGLADNMAAEQAKVGDLAAAAQWSQRAAGAWRGLAERAGAGAARARLRTGFAEAYAHYIQGELEPAATLLADALAADAGPADAAALRDERASAATLLVGALANLGRYDDAIAAADAALAELAKQGAVETRAGLALLRDRGATLVTAGRAADGLAELERAMAVHAAIFGARGEGYARLLNERGIAFNDLGRYTEARRDFEQSLRFNGTDADASLDPVVVGNLASVCSSIGDWDCALAGYRRMLDGLASGPTMLPQQVRLNRQAYARALSESGDTQTARPLLEEALAAAIGEDGEGSPNAAASLLHLARNELRAGRSAAALAFASRARAAFAALVPPAHFVFAALDRIEGFAALGEGRIDDAQRLIESYHDATVATDGADSYWAALAGLDLAQLRNAQGRDDQARALLRQHLPKVRDTVLPTHPDRAAGEALAVRLGVD